MSVEMKKKVLTKKKEKTFNCLISTEEVWEIYLIFKKSILSSSLSSFIHNISTLFMI
jgi:hypothetical protein